MHSWSIIQTDGDEEEAIEEDVHEDYPVINCIDSIYNNFIYRPTSMKIREGRDCEVEKFLNQDYTFFSTQPISYATTNIPEQINSSVEKVLIHLLDLSLIPRSKKSAFIHSWYDLSNYTSVEATRMVNQFIDTNYKHIDKKSWEFRIEITWASTYLSQYSKYQRTQQQSISHSIRIFHYIGLGFPPPDRNRIWMKDISPTGSTGLQELSQTFYPPCLLIFDCHKAAILKDYLNDSLVKIISKLDHNGFSIDPSISKLFFAFFACSENEQLRIASNLPQNFFTCALLTPGRAFSAITGITVTNLPLFESLLIIFTDTIALETLTTDLFYRLFRGDSIVSNLWRRFLLAQRLMKTFGLHSQSIPDLPDMSEHQLWGQFEFSLMSVGIFNPLIRLSDLYINQFESTECPPDYVCAFVSSLLQLPDSITSNNGNSDPTKKSLKDIVMSKIAAFMEKSPNNCRLIASFINFKNIGDFQTYLNSKKNSFCDHCTIMSGLLLVASSILKVVNASFSMSDAIRVCFDKHHFNDKIRVYILSILVALRDVQSRLSCFFNTENTTDKFLPLLFQSSPLLREWILLFIHSTISRFSLEIKIGSSYLHVYCMLLLSERRKLTRAAAVNILTTVLIPRCYEFNRTIMSCALKAAIDGSRVVRYAFLCMAARFAFLNNDHFDGKINDNVNNNATSNGFYHCTDNDVSLINASIASSSDGRKNRESFNSDYSEDDVENNGNNDTSNDLTHNSSEDIFLSSSNSNLSKKDNFDFQLTKVTKNEEEDDKIDFYKVDASPEDLGIDPNLDYLIREDPITFAKMNDKPDSEDKSEKTAKSNNNSINNNSGSGFYQTIFNKSDIQKESRGGNSNGFYKTVFDDSDFQSDGKKSRKNSGFYQTVFEDDDFQDEPKRSNKNSNFYLTKNEKSSNGFYQTKNSHDVNDDESKTDSSSFSSNNESFPIETSESFNNSASINESNNHQNIITNNENNNANKNNENDNNSENNNENSINTSNNSNNDNNDINNSNENNRDNENINNNNNGNLNSGNNSGGGVKNDNNDDGDGVDESGSKKPVEDELLGSAPSLSLLLRKLVKRLCRDPYPHIRKFAQKLLKNPVKSSLEESYLRNSIEVHKMAHLLLFSGSLDRSEMQQRYTDTFLACDELELFETFNANIPPDTPLSQHSSSDRFVQSGNDPNSIMEPENGISSGVNSLYKPYLGSAPNYEATGNKGEVQNGAVDQIVTENIESTNTFFSSKVVSICFDLEHNNVVAATANGFVIWGDNRWQIPGSENSVKPLIHSIVALPKLSLAVAASNGYIHILRNGFYDPIDSFQPSTTHPSGKTIMTAVSFDAKPISKSKIKEKNMSYHKNMNYGQTKTTLLYVAQGNNEILVWDIEALLLIKRIPVPSPPTMMQIIKTENKISRPTKLPFKNEGENDADVGELSFSSSKKLIDENDASNDNINQKTVTGVVNVEDDLITKNESLGFSSNSDDNNKHTFNFGKEQKSPFFSAIDHDFQYSSSSSSNSMENDLDNDIEDEFNVTQTECYLYASLQNGSIIKINTNINEIVDINNMYKNVNNNTNESDNSNINENDNSQYIKIGVHKNILFSVSKNGPLYFWEDFQNPKQVTESWNENPVIDFNVHPLFPVAIRIDDHSVSFLKIHEGAPVELQLCSGEMKNESNKIIGTCSCFDGSRPLCAIGYDDGTVAVWRLKVL